ncbi:MAG: hypothetical protein M3O15_11395 [Acidobacteriota bacterium]|nr:hypothetical protein [Acidobacteriota bacterium]
MPCAALTSASNLPGDPFPDSGCSLQAIFQTPGQRVVTLTGQDSFGLTATATLTLDVLNPLSNGRTVRQSSPSSTPSTTISCPRPR